MTSDDLLRAFAALPPEEQAAVRQSLGAEAGGSGPAGPGFDSMVMMQQMMGAMGGEGMMAMMEQMAGL